MTKRMISYSLLILFVISKFILLTACSSNDEQTQAETVSNSTNKTFKNFNITILLDLSDRISNRKNPEQYKKDIVFINNVLDVFKLYLTNKGVVQSEDRIKVIFYPYSNNEIYQLIADSLNIDFAEYDFKNRKQLFEEIIPLYNRQLNKLYSIASNAKSYSGSDLFNYFKHRVEDDCIIVDPNFINLLIILTDGYIYDANSRYQEYNRFSYLIPEADHIKVFRKINNWEKVFESQDYGLINLNNDLSNLYLILGEFNPIKNSPQDFDILKKYWSEWLENQKVQKDNYKILKTDLNILNRDNIRTFFRKVVEDHN